MRVRRGLDAVVDTATVERAGRRQTAVVLRALGLGDLLTAVPALRAVRRALPRHRIVLLAPQALAPLALATGAVDDVRELEGKDAVDEAAALPQDLVGCDVAVNLHGQGPESSLLLARLEPGRLVAHRHVAVAETADGPRWNDALHEVVRWCRLVEAAGMRADPADLDLVVPRRIALDGPVGPRLEAAGATLVHPGAASGARRWPAERWADVARALADDGRRVLVTGGPAERDLAVAVAHAAGLGDDAVVAGALDVLDLAGGIAVAAQVLCGDTGIAHLATAVGTPSVVLFGPSSPSRWGPPADRPQHRVLWAGEEGDPLADEPDPGLLRIGVEAVLDAARAGVPSDPRHPAAVGATPRP